MPIYVNDSPASLGEYFFASVGLKNGNLVELGSRTLAAVGVGNTISEAEKIAEQKIKTVEGPTDGRARLHTVYGPTDARARLRVVDGLTGRRARLQLIQFMTSLKAISCDPGSN